MHTIPEGCSDQAGELTHMSICKGNLHSIGSKVVEPRERISNKAGLSLFAIGDDRRSSSLKPLYRVAQSIGIGIVELSASEFPRLEICNGLNQRRRTWDATNRFSQDRHAGESSIARFRSHPSKDGLRER